MKFWQRFLILGSAFFLAGTLYYYTLLENSVDHSPQLLLKRSMVSGLGMSFLNTIIKSFSFELDPVVCQMHPGVRGGGRIYANFSTLDLYNNANFNVLADGMYELPTPPPDYPRNVPSDELETLNVIIMPHSHADPGWLKTTNEYYTDQAKYILTNMVNKLTQYPDMTFVWAETIYFAMWWNELEDAVKVHVRRLIRRGQLEIALGGWVMPDEASTHYVSVIDQLVEGHQWLWENLGVRPKNSWSIDPFGYSGTMPYLWKLAGMDNMVIQRVHQAVKASLMAENSLEFWWHQYWDDTGKADILCHVMPYMLYSIKFSCGPNRFVCLLFDFRSVPGDFSDSRAVPVSDDNLKRMAESMYKQFRQKSYYYKYNTILVPLGDDFRFDREEEWDQQHGNYSKLIKYMNAQVDWKIKVRFGTLKDYFKLTRQEELGKKYAAKDTDFPVLSGDFFPYSDRNLEYWSGYFTTRPFDKRFQREVQGLIQAADVMMTFSFALYKRWGLETQNRFFHYASLMQAAHRAQGQFLHHDAITGTSKDFVVVDFEHQLLGAYNKSQSVMSMALQSLLTKGKLETPYVILPETVRPRYNEPPKKVVLPITESGTYVLVFNPLPQYRQELIRVIVNSDTFIIKNHLKDVVPCQINPIWDPEVETNVRSDRFEVIFVAELPPLASMPFFFLKRHSMPNTSFAAKISVFNTDKLFVPPETLFFKQHSEASRKEPVTIANEHISVRVNPQTGTILDIEDRSTGNKTKLNMNFEMYRSQGSGAYLFYPSDEATKLINNIPLLRVVDGPLVTQLTVVYEPYVEQTLSLYHHPSLLTNGLYINNLLNIQTMKDREIIMKMRTDLKIKQMEFFSDQNGFQFVKRRTNSNGKVEANYYPMTSGAFLDDGIQRVSVLSAQSHGIGSMEAGCLEVMLDRQLGRDDDRGMGQGVEDIKPVTSEFIILVEKRKSSPQMPSMSQAHYAFPSVLSLSLSDRLQQPPQVFYTTVESDIFFTTLQPLKAALPCDISLVSLRSLSTNNLQYNGTSLILHRRAYDCEFPAQGLQCAVSGKPIGFDLLFSELGLGPHSIKETTLTHLQQKRSLSSSASIDMHPMQISSYHLLF